MEPENHFGDLTETTTPNTDTPFDSQTGDTTPDTSSGTLGVTFDKEIINIPSEEVPAAATAPTPDPTSPPNQKPEAPKDQKSDTATAAHKRRVVKVEQDGVYTMKWLERTNFLLEWRKGLITSTPFMVRLLKIFWKISPRRVSILIAINLLRAGLPSLASWRMKQFLDEVQRVSVGHSPRLKRLIMFALLGVGHEWVWHGLNYVS